MGSYCTRLSIIYWIFQVQFGYVLVKADSETFSTMATLRELVKAENDLLQLVGSDDTIGGEIRRMISLVEDRQQYEESNATRIPYLGHPLNVLHLIKRWYKLQQALSSSPGDEDVKEHLKSVPRLTHDDLVGAHTAIIRLQQVFQFNVESALQGNINGYQSVHKLQPDEVVGLGESALQARDYGLAVEWLMKASEEQTEPELLIRIYSGLASAWQKMGNYKTGLQYVNAALELEPGSSTLKQQQNWLIDNHNSGNSLQLRHWQRPVSNSTRQYEQLCRGEPDATTNPRHFMHLICYYKKGFLPYVRFKHEVLSWSPRIGMFYEVISDSEADQIIQKGIPLLYRGLTGDPKTASKSNIRISNIAWLWDDDPLIATLSQRVSQITGLDTEIRSQFSSSEPFQVVNYGIGGYYDPHHDYYEDDASLMNLPPFLQNTGDRIATFLFYLNDIQVGGSTVYPLANIRVPLVKNAGAFWYNAKPSGEYDYNTQHAGCPVLIGQKWVSNKWIREYGQEFRRLCGLTLKAVDKTLQ